MTPRTSLRRKVYSTSENSSQNICRIQKYFVILHHVSHRHRHSRYGSAVERRWSDSEYYDERPKNESQLDGHERTARGGEVGGSSPSDSANIVGWSSGRSSGTYPEGRRIESASRHQLSTRPSTCTSDRCGIENLCIPWELCASTPLGFFIL